MDPYKCYKTEVSLHGDVLALALTVAKFHYDAGFLAFGELIEVAIAFLEDENTREIYVEPAPPPPKFHKFRQLPNELQEQIIHEYLHSECESGMLEKCLHHDDFGNPCCVWYWPDELIVCDRYTESELPSPKFPPWLPNLAFVDRAMLPVIACCMLRTTARFDFKYEWRKEFKIVPWFMRFLDEVGGWGAIKDVNFPYEHWYNHDRQGRVIGEKNPDVELMIKCKNLVRAGFTFHYEKLTMHDPENSYERIPKPLNEFLDFYHLRPIVCCKNLEYVYLDGIYNRYGSPFPALQTLKNFGNALFDEYKRENDGKEL